MQDTKGNGYYIYFLQQGSLGVKKKINSQAKVLGEFFSMKTICVGLRGNTIPNKIARKLPFGNTGYDYDIVKKNIEDPAIIYVRRTNADRDYINFFRYIKTKYPNCKVVVEFYTYPYDKDDYKRNLKHFVSVLPFYFRDKIYRNKLYKYVDRIVTFSKDDMIFNIPTIKTANGVDVNEIIPTQKIEKTDNINLISVARMQVHHGYERIILGLADYYKNGGSTNYVYHVVGDGSELSHYQSLVDQNGLSDRVIFYGSKTGKDLDDVFNKADLAISSLGLYKYGIDLISPLKVGEYFARGVPVISACKLSVYNKEMYPFISEFPNDATPIDFFEIDNFIKTLYQDYSKEEIVDLMRKCAFEFCDMKVTMKPVVDYFLS